MLYHLRVAARGLRRHPLLALASICTLALGIGANTAVFSVIHGVLVQPLPYKESGRLALLTSTSSVSIPDGVDLRARSRTLASVGLLIRSWDATLTGQGEPQRLAGVVVEPQVFDILGVQPVRGRAFIAADNVAGGPRVALISVGFWRRQFGADPAIIGRMLVLNEKPTTVIGVMPAAADVFGDRPDVWLPVATETPWALNERGTNNFDAVARLGSGATWADARRELRDISGELTAAYPQTNTGKVIVPKPLLDALVGDVRTPLLLLEGTVLMILVLVTANVGGLLIVRGSQRQGEVVIRTALGAGTPNLVIPLAAEGALIGVVGGLLGVALASAGQGVMGALFPASLPRARDIQLDRPVMATSLALIAVIVFVLAVGPAVHALRGARRGRLPSQRSVYGSQQGRTLLNGLVAVEVALAVVVMSLSVLLGRTFIALEHLSLGFDPTGVVTGELVLPEARYADTGRQTRVFREVVSRLATAPGVDAAGSVIGLPLGPGDGIGHAIAIEGRPAVAPGAEPSVRVRPVTGDYFGTLRIPLMSGRRFTDADDERGMPVAIVNEAFVRALWPDASPIGHRIKWVGGEGTPPWMTIVGIVGDTRTSDLATGDRPAVYFPYVQHTEAWQRWGTLVARGEGGAQRLAAAMRAAVAGVDPLLPVGRLVPLVEYRSAALAQQRLDAILLGIFGAAALLIATQGIYGTMAYVVSQRVRELGIRVAVGATPRRVWWTAMGRSMGATAVGLGAGLIAAVAVGQVAQSVLFGVSARDATVYVLALAVIGLAAWCGAAVPALRATRIDPAIALTES